MGLKLKVFGPYGLMPRVADRLEKDFNEWSERSKVELKDVAVVTANLPDRTMILLVLYNAKEGGK